MILNHDERLQVLFKCLLLDSAPEEAFDRFTQLAVTLLDVPMSLVTHGPSPAMMLVANCETKRDSELQLDNSRLNF